MIHIISKGGLPLIEFRNVSKVYNNGTEALHNINLKVDKGEFVFIVGSSGAGKSTFLKLITCEDARTRDRSSSTARTSAISVRARSRTCAERWALYSRTSA